VCIAVYKSSRKPVYNTCAVVCTDVYRFRGVTCVRHSCNGPLLQLCAPLCAQVQLRDLQPCSLQLCYQLSVASVKKYCSGSRLSDVSVKRRNGKRNDCAGQDQERALKKRYKTHVQTLENEWIFCDYLIGFFNP